MKKQLLIIIFATVLAYLNIFNNQFAVDDHIFVGKYNPNVIQAFTGAVPLGHEGIYRPIRGIFYTIYNQFWGANPIGYHINSLAVHLASTILIFLIVRILIKNLIPIKSGKYLPFLAALLFGLHPIHTETITYMASAMDSIGIVFFLGAFYLYLRNKIIPSVILAGLAFFTTEMALTLPLLILLYEIVINAPTVIPDQSPVIPDSDRESRMDWFPASAGMTEGVKEMTKKILPYFVGVGIYLFVRFAVLDITTRGPYLANSFFLTMLTMTKVLIQYIWVLIWPVNLASNHIISPGIEAFVYRNYQTLAISKQSIFDLDILLSITIIIFLIFIVFISRKKYPIVSFSLGWFFISLLPVMDFVPQGSMMNERSLYIASFGFVLLLAFGLGKLKWQKLGFILIMLIAVFYTGKTYVRNQDWRNDITLWQADIRLSPNQNAYARFALGNAYNDRKDFQKAIDQYSKSVEINPGFAVGWASLGRTYADMGKVSEAITNYKRALEIDPNFWEVKNNLNNIYNRL